MDSLKRTQPESRAETPAETGIKPFSDDHANYKGSSVCKNTAQTSFRGIAGDSFYRNPGNLQLSIQEKRQTHGNSEGCSVSVVPVQSSGSPTIQSKDVHNLPTATPMKPYASTVTNQEQHLLFRDQLKKLAGIPNSRYHRHFPPVSGYDTHYSRGLSSGSDTGINCLLNRVLTSYDLPDRPDFAAYLATKDLPVNIFSKDSFLMNQPLKMLEIVVHFIFSSDPALRNVSFTGGHGYVLSYLDKDILEENQLENSCCIEGIEVKYTQNNKPIIQQQATRGCAYAVAAMLMYQYQRSFSAQELRSTNCANSDFIMQTLSSAGLSPVKSKFKTLDALTEAVDNVGSAIVTVDNAVGGHTVIVDQVAGKFVLIRDPYHGWEVKISREAFLKSWGKDAIQVEKPPSTSIKPQSFI